MIFVNFRLATEKYGNIVKNVEEIFSVWKVREGLEIL